jgi:hypothetical protein
MIKKKSILLSLCLLMVEITFVYSYPVPDTGQTKCYNNLTEIPCPQPGEPFYGQDANYTIHAPSYTKMLDYQTPVPKTGNYTYNLVYDNVTGMIWNSTTSGNVTWKCSRWACMPDYLSGLKATKPGGIENWAVPPIWDLFFISNLGRPTADDTFFPGTPTREHWTNTTFKLYPGLYQWLVGFDTGSITEGDTETYSGPIRAYCPFNRFLNDFRDNYDGTVSDYSTGLMWIKVGSTSLNWQQALSYCENLEFAGHNDWRLPNAHELMSIVNYGAYNPTSSTALPAASDWYHSSTTRPGYNTYSHAIHFCYGQTDYYGSPGRPKTLSACVRCVRTFAYFCIDRDNDGWCVEQGDCYDNDATIYPGAPELCDGLDNDCDDEIDEGIGPGVPELCDGLDNDCDGQVDEGLGQTTCGTGICEHTVDNCMNGEPQICNPMEGAIPEICGDGLDNDCDGLIDCADPDCSSTPQCQTAITLSSFVATPKSGAVLLKWQTETEIDTIGFNLYRAESENGEYVKINGSLIPAVGSPTQGATYQLVDENVQNRRTYWYKLEDIDIYGTSSMHGPISAGPKRVPSVE